MDEVMDIGYGEIHLGDTGGKEHAQLRPHIVLFGERVPNIRKADEEVAKADILLIVGTSLKVYPAADLYMFAPSNCEIYVIDPVKPEIDLDRPVYFIEEKATIGMETFAHEIGFLSDEEYSSHIEIIKSQEAIQAQAEAVPSLFEKLGQWFRRIIGTGKSEGV